MYKLRTFLILALFVVNYSCNKDDSVTLIAPIATQATEINNDVFVANWQAVNGASSYELQVSTARDFSTDLILMNNLSRSTSNTAVSPVKDNTEYFYKVRARINNENVSPFSNIVSVFTLPNPPLAIEETNITTSSFTANWSAVEGIAEYKIFVSTGTPPEFGGQILSNYNGVLVNGNSFSVTGLEFNRVYYYQIKAISGDRASKYSNSIPVLVL